MVQSTSLYTFLSTGITLNKPNSSLYRFIINYQSNVHFSIFVKMASKHLYALLSLSVSAQAIISSLRSIKLSITPIYCPVITLIEVPNLNRIVTPHLHHDKMAFELII